MKEVVQKIIDYILKYISKNLRVEFTSVRDNNTYTDHPCINLYLGNELISSSVNYQMKIYF